MFPKLILLIFPLFFSSINSTTNPELDSLLHLKLSLDPSNKILTSWKPDTDPCDGTFEGVGCNHLGQVANISLQSKGLIGQLSSAISGLKYLTGIYLHYNSINGGVPKEIGDLSNLVDLYLNVNNLSGTIPAEIGEMKTLQVLQLCYNQLTGGIPSQLGSLKNLTVLALQSNKLTGAIPASLGDIETLMRLDLSFNHLFGSIPTPIAESPLLKSIDIRNNTLSGNVPSALLRLNEGFQFANNPGLCGVGFHSLKPCPNSDHTDKIKPETANIQPNCNPTKCSKPSKRKISHSFIAVTVVITTIALSFITVFFITKYRRAKQKLATTKPDPPETRFSTRRNGSALISLEYPNGWDPLSDNPANEVIQGFRFNLEDVECATQYFSPANLLDKSGFLGVYRGVLRDMSGVAIKRVSKSSCKVEDNEFLKGLNVLTSLRHENLVRLRGFCCSKERGECFLIYDFVPNGNLLRYLDLNDEDANVLEWATRVRIINGVAKGIQYLHNNKPSLIHQNITAKKVLIDHRMNAVVSDSGLHKLLTNDTVFSTLKSSAAMGYMAPEYTTTGRFTEKSDVYAFGKLVFQVISGKKKITKAIRVGAELSQSREFIDRNLHERFSEFEADKLARIALSCTRESPLERPSMDEIVVELSNCSTN